MKRRVFEEIRVTTGNEFYMRGLFLPQGKILFGFESADTDFGPLKRKYRGEYNNKQEHADELEEPFYFSG